MILLPWHIDNKCSHQTWQNVPQTPWEVEADYKVNWAIANKFLSVKVKWAKKKHASIQSCCSVLSFLVALQHWSTISIAQPSCLIKRKCPIKKPHVYWSSSRPAAVGLNLPIMMRSANGQVALNRHRDDQEYAESCHYHQIHAQC